MILSRKLSLLLMLFTLLLACTPSEKEETEAPQSKTAAEILGNPTYQAISYGGYRENNRDEQPSIAQLKEDMKILSAMGIRIFRTYNTHFPHAKNVLAAIQSLKDEDPSFEMYVMLGVWINCKDAFQANPNHDEEDAEANAAEVQRAVDWAKKYPDIIKVIAVGNEAMVKWAASYFVQPAVILKWVNHLQALKQSGVLPADLWITSSDNFASWGGGGTEYHVEDLEKLLRAVDYVSLHTYPMHDTHYNPAFWGSPEEGTDVEKVAAAMEAAKNYAIKQYEDTKAYIRNLGVEVPIHIGETGWASYSNGFYGDDGSKATDEYKEALYYHQLREWTDAKGISCFFFEAFDENWKDAANPGGSENHFGLFTIDGQAKYAIWDLVDQGVFEGLGRAGKPITKTYDGDQAALLQAVQVPAPIGNEQNE